MAGPSPAADYAVAMSGPLSDIVRRWTELGRSDPLWAALTNGESGGRWDVEKFLETGREEIGAVLALLARRGVTPPFGTALDFGCGPGRLSAALAGAGFARVVGIDISPPMLAKAREIVSDPRCEFTLGEGSGLDSIADDSVDFVYTCRVLQHMSPQSAHSYVREFLRVVSPGGVVVFQIPSEPVPGTVGKLLRAVPAALADRLRSGMQMHGTPLAAMTRTVAEAGGVTVSVEDDTNAGPRWRSHLYVVRSKG